MEQYQFQLLLILQKLCQMYSDTNFLLSQIRDELRKSNIKVEEKE